MVKKKKRKRKEKQEQETELAYQFISLNFERETATIGIVAPDIETFSRLMHFLLGFDTVQELFGNYKETDLYSNGKKKKGEQ